MDLNKYDVILINSSGGKDSQAMLDHLVHEATVQFFKGRVVVVHCDLGRAEWAGTRELAEEQAKHYGCEFIVVSRPQGDLLDQIEARGMFPSSNARYCTSDQKTGQVAKVLTQLANEHREAGNTEPVRILNCLGLRAAESSARAKRPEFRFDKRASNGKRHVDTYLPIFNWSKDEVWAAIKKSGVRHHRAYDLGMPRLSCVFCVFAPKPALMLAGKHNPELLAQYVALEEKIDHKFTMKLSLADVAEALANGEEPGPINTWEM